jgi:HAD superfamily hydrolase (TIGR01490 family)
MAGSVGETLKNRRAALRFPGPLDYHRAPQFPASALEQALALAIFDLDNTLLAGDSDYLWGRFLVERGIVDEQAYASENERFFRAYQAGTLDIREYLAFALRPLAENDPSALRQWRREFIEEQVQPIVLRAGLQLVESHRQQGDTLLIITATNRFVTEPIAGLFGIHHLLATTPETRDGRYTGGVVGIPTFREGKVEALDQWLAANDFSLSGSHFYSDSHNDLPLLQRVAHPVAVDPDPELEEQARRRGWPIITLRD